MQGPLVRETQEATAMTLPAVLLGRGGTIPVKTTSNLQLLIVSDCMCMLLFDIHGEGAVPSWAGWPHGQPGTWTRMPLAWETGHQ